MSLSSQAVSALGLAAQDPAAPATSPTTATRRTVTAKADPVAAPETR